MYYTRSKNPAKADVGPQGPHGTPPWAPGDPTGPHPGPKDSPKSVQWPVSGGRPASIHHRGHDLPVSPGDPSLKYIRSGPEGARGVLSG